MIEFLLGQANHAHFYAFGLLMLAGLNIPISEDLVMIGSAVLAATVVPDNIYLLIAGAFLGAYLSDLENYWLARLVGRKLLKIPIVEKLIDPERLAKTKKFLDRFGPAALLFGRFIPFGFRNAFFMTAGFSKMKFWKFALFDFLACVMTTTVLFSLGYSFGKNYRLLLEYLGRWKIYIFIGALVIISTIIILARLHAKKNSNVLSSKETEEDNSPDESVSEAGS